MATRKTNASKFTSLSLMALMCTISPIAVREAAAQETQPGDACIAAQTGFFYLAADDTPGPTSEGQNFLYCDGTSWKSFIQYNDASDSVFMRAPSAAASDALFGNSHWSMWLDETNDQFELKARKSDGTIINSTVGLGGGGLWTDNTTHITYTGSAAHFINTGQTLPAGFDGNGTRMFFYPDKEAFRGGEITGGNDAWQDANIGTHSFAWGRNSEAAGNFSVALGSGNTASNVSTTAIGNYSDASSRGGLAIGYFASASSAVLASSAIGHYAVASGPLAVAIGASTAAGQYAVSMGGGRATGDYSLSTGITTTTADYGNAFGSRVTVGDGLFVGGDPAQGSVNEGVGEASMAFGLQTSTASVTQPRVTGNRSAVFFFDGDVNGNANYNFTASDRLGLVGGQLQIGETQLQGAAAGCIQFNEATDQLEWSHDCTTYNAFSTGGASLWTDNTTHITRENFNIIDTGQALPAGFDADGARAFYYTDKQAFRGGEITGGNDAWQDANIGTHSFAWGRNVEASGDWSVALGFHSFANGNYSTAIGGGGAIGALSFATGWSTASGYGSSAFGGSVASSRYAFSTQYGTASGNKSVALGSGTASGTYSVAMGYRTVASGYGSFAAGSNVIAGNGVGQLNQGGTNVGNFSMAFGLQEGNHAPDPVVSGHRSAVFFFDSDVNNANANYDFTATDRLGLVGGQLQIGETQVQGAAAGCIQFNEATDQMEWSHDCTTYNAFSSGGGLWTDNTTHVTQTDSAVHLIKTGQALPAVLDDDGTRMFFYPDKRAFRGGEIAGGNDAWQDANIGTHSFAWGQNVEAAGSHSVAMGRDSTATGNRSFALGYGSAASGGSSVAIGYTNTASGYAGVAMGYNNIASGNFGSLAVGYNNTASGYQAVALGRRSMASGLTAIALGRMVSVGSGTAGDGTGDRSMGVGLLSGNVSFANRPTITGDRAAVFFFDGGVDNANDSYDFTAADRLGLVGGQLQIGETQAQGAAAGCIQFNEATDQLEWSHDCTTYNAFSAGGGLWTDNTTHISRGTTPAGFHILDAGQALPATFDDNGTRAFFYPDKEAFRGGEITGGNDAWQEANIGTGSFAWGLDVQASGANSVAIGDGSTASGDESVALGRNATASGGGYGGSFALGVNVTASNSHSIVAGGLGSTASGSYSAVLGGSGNTASGSRSIATGFGTTASGVHSVAMGQNVIAGSGTAGDGTGDLSIAFGLATNSFAVANKPQITGDRAAVFFFDGHISNSNQNYDFTASDRLGLVGGQLQIGETQAQGAAAGCIQFNEATDQMEWSHDCTTYNAFSAGGAGLWTDNTTHISRGTTPAGFHIIEPGQALPATLDDDGTRAFFYPDKEAFRGGEITGGNDAWQDANIGTHSFAWGLNVEASGSYSIAMGEGTSVTALAERSFAMGYNATASGTESLAIGDGVTAGGFASVATGYATTASGSNSVAMGYNSTASGSNSVAMGNNNTASGVHSFAIGDSNISNGEYSSITMGRNNTASGGYSMAVGSFVTAGSGTSGDGSGEGSMAFGLQLASQAVAPSITGNRTAAFFFDGGVADANSGVDVTADDALIVYGGQVGIGMTTTPDVALDVIGDIEYTGIIRDMSDRRLKENIEELTMGQLQKIIALQAVSFNMKDDENKQLEFGLIAQDVLEIYPELVYENKDGMMSVNYVGLIAPMAEAIEEQHNIIETQKSRIDLLEERLRALEEKIQTGATVHGLILSLLALGL